jgi:hypothetical protein
MSSPDPIYEDKCGHTSASYQGTCIESLNGYTVDVYVFEDSIGLNVCLRYGNEAHEYYSTFGGERLKEIYGPEVAELVGWERAG